MTFTIKGERYRESTGARDEDEARAYLQKRLKDIHRQNRKVVTVDTLLGHLETQYVLRGMKDMTPVRGHMKAVRDSIGELRANRVTDDVVTRYIQQRLEAGRAPGTVNKEIGILGRAFRLGIEAGKVKNMPRIRRLPERNVRQGFFEPGEVDAVVAYLPDYLKGFVRFAYFSGWRKGEISSLTWNCLDPALSAIRLRPDASKNGQGRVVALTEEMQELFKNLRGSCEYVFHRHGKPIGKFDKAWKTAMKKAGLEGRLFHDLRRSAVRDMVRAGVPEKVAMSISGHKTRSIFDRYNIVDEDDLREALKRTEKYRKSQQEN